MTNQKTKAKKATKNTDKYHYLGMPFNTMTKEQMLGALIQFADLYESTDKTVTAQIEENLRLWQDRAHHMYLLAKFNQIIERQKLYDSEETRYPNLVLAVGELLAMPQKIH